MTTNDPDYSAIPQMIDRLGLQERFRNAELRRLCVEPNMALVMTQLADEFEGALAVLFNYSHVVWNNGKGQTEVQEVYNEILDAFEDSYQKMLGVAYIPRMARQRRFAEQEKKHNAEKLLDAIMQSDPDKSTEE